MKKWLKIVSKWLARLLLLLVVLAGISMVACSLPSLAGRTQSQALTPAQMAQTALGQAVLPEQTAHPNLTGVYLLPDPRLAFAARAKLAQQAQKTLDVQYYIWHGDTTGLLLLEALRDAAERGVRVRLLLDDNGTSGLDAQLSALDAHPNIEVRLFNPFVFRGFKPFGYVTDFSRANRRMHNKSFTADNVATVVGGRNVGDEYFGATDGVLFADLDALVVGDVVGQVSQSFDAYWHSDSAYPVASILPNLNDAQRSAALAHIHTAKDTPAAQTYVQAIQEMLSVGKLVAQGSSHLKWLSTTFVADPPSKGLAQLEKHDLLLSHIGAVLGQPKQSLDVVSPYFVPTQEGTDYFLGLVEQGVRVRILTNSMAATDVLAVHSGYAKHRQRLVDGGVLLYEMKPNVGSGHGSSMGFLGSSGSSLHAKTFGADNQRVFIGSFNFDPRSAQLNTELGIVLEDADMGAQMDQVFQQHVPQTSWQVVNNPVSGKIEWLDRQTGEVLHNEPMSSWWQRTAVTVLGALPIEWML